MNQDLTLKYKTHGKRKFNHPLDSCIIYEHVFNRNADTLQKLSNYFDDNYDYEIDIEVKIPQGGYHFSKLKDFIEFLSRWNQKASDGSFLFRFGSFKVIIKEVNGKDLYTFGEIGQNLILYYEYYRNSKDEDVFMKLLSLQSQSF